MRNGHTNSLRFCTRSEKVATTSISTTARRNGAALRSPICSMPRDEPERIIAGIQSTSPYTPKLQQKYWRHKASTPGTRSASRKFAVWGREACSRASASARCVLLSSGSQRVCRGLSRATRIQTKAHSTEGMPSRMKRHLPADCPNQVSRCGGHPRDRNRISQNQDGIGSRALRAREPVGQQNDHRRKDQALRDAQQQPVNNQQPVVVNDPGQSGKNPPADQREKDQPGRASAHRVSRRRHLEEKIAEKEDRAEKSRARLGDVERLCQPCGCAEAEVRPPQVGEAVGHEDHRHQVQPAPAQGPPGFSLRFANRRRAHHFIAPCASSAPSEEWPTQTILICGKRLPIATILLSSVLETDDSSLHRANTRAPGPSGALPLSPEMLLTEPSGNLFGLYAKRRHGLGAKSPARS